MRQCIEENQGIQPGLIASAEEGGEPSPFLIGLGKYPASTYWERPPSMKTDDLAPGGALSRFGAGHIRTPGNRKKTDFGPAFANRSLCRKFPFNVRRFL